MVRNDIELKDNLPLELLQTLSSPTRLWSEPISLPEPCTHLSARVDSPNRTASPSLALKLNRQAPSRWLSCLTRRNQSMHSFPCSLPRWSFSSWLWRSLRSSSSATRLRISPSFQQGSQIELNNGKYWLEFIVLCFESGKTKRSIDALTFHEVLPVAICFGSRTVGKSRRWRVWNGWVRLLCGFHTYL